MQSIFKDDKKRKITKTEDILFDVKTAGLYLTEISAIVKNEKQLSGTDDEDLKLEIDKRKFPTPASFSGGTSKGLKKTVYFISLLSSEEHKLSLIPDISATLVKIEVFKMSEDSYLEEFDLSINEQAEDGDRRAWITFVLVDLALNKFITGINLKRRFIDSDDVKVVIDGNIKRNDRSILHKLWYFAASILTGENQTETFAANLSRNLHYIEFWADRMPILKNIIFYGLSSKEEKSIEDKIRAKAQELKLDPDLMVSLAKAESGLDPKATSPVGAKGIFQLMDITIKQIANLGYKITDPYNANQNIAGGTLYFKWLYDMYEGKEDRLEKTLAAWNWGQNNFPKDGPLNFSSLPPETQQFINKVLGK